MDQKTALGRQNQSVDNAQDRVDGVGILRLKYLPAGSACIPSGAKIAAVQGPVVFLPRDLDFIVHIRRGSFNQFDVEFEIRMRGGYDETRVARRQHVAESRVLTVNAHGNPADLDGDRGGFGRMAHSPGKFATAGKWE